MSIRFGKLQDGHFYFERDGELESVGYVDAIEIISDEDDAEDEKMKYLDSRTFYTSFTIDDKSVEEIWKYVVFGGDRGRYNGYVLHRDGYLSPKNAWIGGDA